MAVITNLERRIRVYETKKESKLSIHRTLSFPRLFFSSYSLILFVVFT